MTARADAVARTDLPLPLERRGKVRDVYRVDRERLLIVATDRVSAFDVVMADPVPWKGIVLTQLTAWWLNRLAGICSHHMISADDAEIAEQVPAIAGRDDVTGRAMLVRATNVLPIECVVRGYLSGSAWSEYRRGGTLAGEPLSKGLAESARLEPPIFSPATKAETGHDENIPVARAREILGERVAAEVERLARQLYDRGAAIALERGIIVADTKFEFGVRGGETILIDEVLTPDSSRFWPAAAYRAGSPQPSLDKQPLRDYLALERDAGRWNGESPGPALPAEVIDAMSERYLEIYERLTGRQVSGIGDRASQTPET